VSLKIILRLKTGRARQLNPQKRLCNYRVVLSLVAFYVAGNTVWSVRSVGDEAVVNETWARGIHGDIKDENRILTLKSERGVQFAVRVGIWNDNINTDLSGLVAWTFGLNFNGLRYCPLNRLGPQFKGIRIFFFFFYWLLQPTCGF
jgi:hypothetical protein